jgi:hypothetical protein
MTPSIQDLERRYREMPDDMVITYCRSGTLLPEALRIAEAEAQRRGLDIGTDAEDEVPEDMPPPGDLVTIARLPSVTDARVLEARLLAEGIGASVTDAHLFQAMNAFGVGLVDVRVQVPEAQVLIARQVLAAIEAGEYRLDGDEAEQEPAPSAPADATGLSAEDIGAYAHHPYYARVSASMGEGARRWAGVNVSVLMFGSLWFFYRRLPLAAVTYLLGVGAIFLLLGWLAIDDWQDGATSMAARQALLASVVVCRIGAAMVANNLYLGKVRSAIHRLPLLGLSPPDRLVALRANGGPSVLALALAVIVPLVLLQIIQARNPVCGHCPLT